MSLNSEILADSPALYYRLNETATGTITDSSGNARHGVTVGTPTMGVASLDTLDTDKAIEFPGADGNYVNYATGLLYPSGSDFTVECIFKADTLGTFANRDTDKVGSICGYYTTYTHSLIQIHTDGIAFVSDGWTIIKLPYVFVTGKSYHIAVARGPAAGSFYPWDVYVNGTYIGTATDISLNQDFGVRWIGRANDTPYHNFDGVIDEFAVYPTELTAARILAHAEAAGLAPQYITATLEQTVAAVTSRIYASIRQTVFENGTITATLEQTVVYNTGTITATLQQTVFEVGGPLTVTLQQRVFDFSAAGAGSWSVSIVVGGTDLTSALTGKIVIDAREQQAKLATFTIMPALGSIDIYDWVGRSVTIDYSNNGVTDRLFTGLVDEPVYNPVTTLTTFNCTDGLVKQINGLSNDQIATQVGGYWSTHIFDAKTRGWDHARDRLNTIDSAYDLNTNGIGLLTPWAAKATADFEYGDSKVLDATDSVSLAKRDRIHNTHKITFQFRYQRLRTRKRSYYWHYPVDFLQYLQSTTNLPNVEMVRAAAAGNGWALDHDRYEFLPPTGPMRLPGTGQQINWIISEELRAQLIFGARVWIKRRWVQTVTEQYDIKVYANQSVEKLGEIIQQSQFSVESVEDSEGWTDFSKTPAGVVSVSPNSDDIIDVTGGEVSRTDADNALNCIQAMRRTEILDAHRQNDCEFTVLLNPYLERRHTVQRTGSKITAKGKVRAYRHELDLDTALDTTDITLAISKSQATGVPTDTPIAPPAEPDKTDAVATDPRHTVLDTHLGGLELSEPYDEAWTGYLGNKGFQVVRENATYNISYPGAPTYPVEFRIPTPAVDTLLTDAMEAQAAVTVEVAIPEDTLTMAA